MHIDFTPLIPVVNGFITAIAGLLTVSTPVIVAYSVIWLRNHGIALTAQTQAIAVSRLNTTIENGLRYATAITDADMQKLTVNVTDPNIAKAANYVIQQSPQLLKTVGLDPATREGQEALVRLVTAKSVPQVVTPAVDIHVDGETDKKTAAEKLITAQP